MAKKKIGDTAKSIPLNVFLLKDRSKIDPKQTQWTTGEILSKPVDAGKRKVIKVQSHELGEGGSLGTLHIRLPLTESVPDWVPFVSTGLGATGSALAKLKNKSVSAILVAMAAGRQFVLAFGHGRHMIDSACIEHRFGIKVALNSVSPDKIASIDKQTFDATPRISRTQAVRASSVSEYGIDAEQDMLRAVVGITEKAYSGVLGEVLAGMDSLKTTIPVTLEGLGAFLAAALSRSESKDYLKKDGDNAGAFAWVDNFQPVSDQSKVEELNKELWKAMKGKNFSTMWMAVPEIIEWHDFKAFAYTSAQAESGDNLPQVLDIAEFRQTLRKDATLETLKHRKIYMLSSTGAPPRPFSAYKTIYFEHSKSGATHILHAGSWYRIEKSFEQRIKDFFTNLPRMTCTAPFTEYAHDDEEAYNKHVATQPASGYTVLDRKLIHFGGGHSKIEVCDLYKGKAGTSKGKLVHVKRGKGSASLSHLFAQGLVSSNLMAGEPEFIKKVNEQLAANGATALPGVISGKDYELVYAIIDGEDGKPLDIPFFSKVNLESNSRRIQTLGFDVKLMHITEAPLTAGNGKQAKSKKSKKTQKRTAKKTPAKKAAKKHAA